MQKSRLFLLTVHAGINNDHHYSRTLPSTAEGSQTQACVLAQADLVTGIVELRGPSVKYELL